MNNQTITVFYKWTANPGKFDELKEIYEEVRRRHGSKMNQIP